MKLNADIIFSELSARYDVEISGPRSTELSIGRPNAYIDDEDHFLSGNLYLASVAHLPKRPHIQQNVVLVCIGDGLTLNYYRERLCLIIVSSRTDFFGLLRDLQEIYDKYDEWEHALYSGLLSNAELRNFLDSSAGIIRAPLCLIDSSFHLTARTEGSEDVWTGSESLSPASLREYLERSDLMLERKHAIRLDLQTRQILCVNLFDRADHYQGCLFADMTVRGINDGNAALMEFLASLIEQAIDRNPRAQSEDLRYKNMLRSLIEELPLKRSQRMLLSSSAGASYVCACLRGHAGRSLPLEYICGVVEDNFSGSHAFTTDDLVVCIIGAAEFAGDRKLTTYQFFRDLCSQMHMSCGISNAFSDLLDTRLSYLQAVSALENGQLTSPKDSVFFFSSYALTEMIINSLGSLPLEAYYPEGLTTILKHDAESPVSYLDTLRALLEENLSYTAAARRLFIHRTTLLDRVERIEKEMGIDLKNPEQRLQLEILLRAMDLQEVVRNSRSFPD